MPPPSLHKSDFLPFCLPHALARGTRTGRSPNGAQSMEEQFLFERGGRGALGGERRPAASRRRAPGSGRPRGPRGARRGAGPRLRPLAGAGRRPHAVAPRPPAAVAVAARRRAGLRGCARAAAWLAAAAEDLVRGWKGQGVKARLKVEPNFAAGGARGGDACARGAGCGADGAALGGLPGGGGPPPPAPSVAAAPPRAPANNRRP